MKKTLSLISVLALLLCACTEIADVAGTKKAATHSEAEPLPNIVLVMVDDMGFSDISPYGSEIATPNLDKLAEEGMVFNQFRNTSKCFPSRATLMTGQYAQRVGMSTKPEAPFELGRFDWKYTDKGLLLEIYGLMAIMKLSRQLI